MALNNVPQANQRVNATQAPINQNFINYIDNGFLVNHIQFNGAGNTGKHNFVEMPLIVTGTPYNITTTSANEVGLFCQASVLNSLNQPALWFAKQSTLLANAIELSEFTAKGATTGYPLPMSYLLFKLIQGLKVLVVNYPPGGSNTNFPFTVIYPDGITFTTTYGILTSCIASGTGGSQRLNNPLNTLNVTTTGFDMTSNANLGSTVGFYYTVIGI